MSPERARHLWALPATTLGAVVLDADLQTRHDRKYLVEPEMLDDLLAAIAGSASALEIEGERTFRYETVYFDTPELVSYLGAARRRPRRFKVRTRCYHDTHQCTLEVKTRDARGRAVKLRHPYLVADRNVLTDASRRLVASVPEVGGAASQLQRTLTTTYHRSTLFLPDEHGRATIDTGVAFCAPGRGTVSLPGLVLIETKTLARPSIVDRALWSLGRRPIAISKYCTGLAALCPELPANKWDRVLRRHFSRAPVREGRSAAQPSSMGRRTRTFTYGSV